MSATVRWRMGVTMLALSLSAALPQLQAQTVSSKKPATAEEKPGSSLPHEIQHQLLVLPFYSVFDHIAFTLDGANVTLTGQVLRPTLKADAEAVVKSLEGVGRVANQIELLPASASDDELRRGIYRAIYEDSTLARYALQTLPPIHIIVKNGNVALEGVIDSAGDKNLAATRAGGVGNVASLKNNLVVQARGNEGKPTAENSQGRIE